MQIANNYQFDLHKEWLRHYVYIPIMPICRIRSSLYYILYSDWREGCDDIASFPLVAEYFFLQVLLNVQISFCKGSTGYWGRNCGSSRVANFILVLQKEAFKLLPGPAIELVTSVVVLLLPQLQYHNSFIGICDCSIGPDTVLLTCLWKIKNTTMVVVILYYL